MDKKVCIPVVVLKNNLTVPVDLSLMNSTDQLQSFVNASTQYVFNMACEGFLGTNSVRLRSRLTGASSYDTFTAAINGDPTLENTVAALNTLNQGLFSSYVDDSGDPIITIFSDVREFQSISLFDSGGQDARVNLVNTSTGSMEVLANCNEIETLPADEQWVPLVTDDGSFVTGSNAFLLDSNILFQPLPPFVLDDEVECFIQFIDLGNGDNVLYGSLTIPYAGVQPDWSAIADPLDWPVIITQWVADVMQEVSGMAQLPQNADAGDFTGFTYGVNPFAYYPPPSDRQQAIGIGNSFNGAPNLNFGSVSEFGFIIGFSRSSVLVTKDFGTLMKINMTGGPSVGTHLTITSPSGTVIDDHIVPALAEYSKSFVVDEPDPGMTKYVVQAQ